MRYIKMKLVITLVILLTIAAVSGFGRANNSSPHEEIAFSRVTNDLSTNELLPALLKEFGETTRGNVERGKQAISLIFNNANRIVTQNVLDQPQWQEGRCTLCHFNTGPANFTTEAFFTRAGRPCAGASRGRDQGLTGSTAAVDRRGEWSRPW